MPSSNRSERAQRRYDQARARERFGKARRAEAAFSRQLRAIARHVGHIVDTFAPRGIVGEHLHAMTAALEKYAELLGPWAKVVSQRMLTEVAHKDEFAWHERGKQIGRLLKQEIANAPTGEIMRTLMGEQVSLIQSLPREAALRVHKLTMEAQLSGTRAESVAQEIMRSGTVTESRACLIARTEVGRTATNLVQARAQFIGSEAYIWRTVGDADVRSSHKHMNGKVVRWDEPPTLDNLTGHAGALPNCRCFPEPIIPDDL